MNSGTMVALVRRAAVGVALLVALLVVVTAVWIAYTQVTRALRETQRPEQLAAGKGHWLPVEGVGLFVQEWGRPDDPVLLLTHGTGAWSGTWFGLPDALASAGWRVVAVDLPPFGLSRLVGAVDYSRAAQAKRLLALIDSLGVPVRLVGHSFGAGPALEAAMRGGSRLRQLVLVDPALGLGPNGESPRCDAEEGSGGLLANRTVRNVLLAATATWPGLSATFLRQFVHRKDVVTPVLVSAYQFPFGRENFTARLGDWAMAFSRSSCESAASLDMDKLAEWASRDTPVALIWGAEDTITPIAQAEALRRWIPQAEMTVLRGVGHIPHIENPEGFAAALVDAVRQAR